MPQRPAGWSDPYGQRTADAGQPAAAGEPAAEEEPVRPSGVSYPDLPDGRPQYGVRVTNEPRQGEPSADGPRRDGEQR
jgi:hypothetical protein